MNVATVKARLSIPPRIAIESMADVAPAEWLTIGAGCRMRRPLPMQP
jgi:hypothetical protein